MIRIMRCGMECDSIILLVIWFPYFDSRSIEMDKVEDAKIQEWIGMHL